MKPSKSVIREAQALGRLTLEKEAIEAQIKAIREYLESEMKPGDSVEYVADDQPFVLTFQIEDKAIMKGNSDLFKILGKTNFIDVAKVSKTEVEKVFGKAVVADCIDHYETVNKLINKKEK